MKEVPHVIIYTDHDLAHNSFWDSLMIREAVKGTITLEFKRRSYRKSVSRLFTTYTEVITGETTKRLAIDFHDNFDFLSKSNVECCDVYYKVNYRPSFVNSLPKAWQDKVKPFIPHFTVRGEYVTAIASRLIGSWIERINYYNLLQSHFAYPRKWLYQAGLARLKRYNSFVKFSDASRFADIRPVAGRVFFIASLYAENSDEKEEVNLRRINLVRALQQEFGSFFFGGIVKTPASIKRCPELVFDRYLPHYSYLEECKKADVCIYSNGPNNCLSWKLGEYLWLGKPVVSERLFNSFDSSFVPHKHIIEADSLDNLLSETVSMCSDKARREKFGWVNSEYYPKLDTLSLLCAHERKNS